jgi:Protein of unknown function (DUF2877)
VRCIAAGSSALRLVLAGPARPAEWLGVTPAALYLRTEHLPAEHLPAEDRPAGRLRGEHPRLNGQPGVLAVLTSDAVRLPCGLLLPVTSTELPLTSLAPAAPALAVGLTGDCLVGDGQVSWTGPRGPVVVRAVREWAPARPARGAVVASALAALRAALDASGPETASASEINSAAAIDGQPLADMVAAGASHEAAAAVARLLGRGPGLTPSGDDVLAGFLVGAWAFGLDTPWIAAAIAAAAPVRTTALSAALLWHAARGECIDQLAAVAAALTSQAPSSQAPSSQAPSSQASGWQAPGDHSATVGPALRRLLAVGHTSGPALAAGLALAAGAAA